MKFNFIVLVILLSISQTVFASSKFKKENKKPVADWTINGNVTLNANYVVTQGSNLFISEGATLIIPNGITLTNNSGGLTAIWNNGTIIIESGGILNNNGDFHNRGIGGPLITVIGTLNNEGFMYDCKLNISGILNNNDKMIIDGNSFSPSIVNNGGIFNNLSSGLVLASFLNIHTGGSLSNAGKLYGDVNISGGGNISNSGIFAPGQSPGVFDITGNYTATSSANHDFEVAGISSNQYDRLLVSGSLNLNGTLNVSLINDFTPTTSHDLTIMTGNVSGYFSTVNLPPSYTLAYNSNSVVLQFNAQALPVTFISLNSEKQSNGVQLRWLVNSELDVSQYDVERSNDGRTFAKIGSVMASGGTHYSFVDLTISNLYYYRVKSIDANGSYKYSSIIKVMGDQMAILFKAFPSPATDQVTLQHPTASLNHKITITSVDGRFIMAVVPNSASQQTQINISRLAVGSYIFSYHNGKETQTLKLIKR